MFGRIYDMDWDDAFDYVTSFMHIQQTKSDVLELYPRITQYLPEIRNVMEIGTFTGANLILLSKLINAHPVSCEGCKNDCSGHILSVDPEIDKSLETSIIRRIVPYKLIHFCLMSGDSLTKQLVDFTISKIGKLDVLNIDGSHTGKDIISDFDLYAPLVDSPGIILFHDVGWAEEVQRTFDQITSDTERMELHKIQEVEKVGIGSGLGFGVLYK